MTVHFTVLYSETAMSLCDILSYTMQYVTWQHRSGVRSELMTHFIELYYTTVEALIVCYCDAYLISRVGRGSVREYVFYVFFIFKKHDFLRFFKWLIKKS